MSKKVLITARAFGEIREPLEILKNAQLEVLEVYSTSPFTEAAVLRQIDGIDAFILGAEKVDEKVLSFAKSLKIAARAGVGYDSVDVKAATEHGVIVTNVVGVLENAVSEMTFALLLSLARRIPTCDAVVRNGSWAKIVGWELSGKTIGIIGMGNIGKGVARIGKAFGMKVLAYDIQEDTSFATANDISYQPLESVLREADFLTLHLPLNPKTKGCIGEKEIDMIKPGAFLVNISRGGIVDEAALYRKLSNGHLRGAALDVYDAEPPRESPLLQLPNVIFSPHVGGSTYESLSQVLTVAAQNVAAVLTGRRDECRFIVNPQVLENAAK